MKKLISVLLIGLFLLSGLSSTSAEIQHKVYGPEEYNGQPLEMFKQGAAEYSGQELIMFKQGPEEYNGQPLLNFNDR
ncbi:hypothetical protein M3204_13880 [Mesobacillus subterraneus]|uniref:hypothetical protein n=1 Tax=Mesobacillus subterraneus TaxID=285983 RepID=UPI00203DB5E1|nr:hypothetical protein [Mesobacillus subterraneus]MCM3665502.1 hypothetical protein [Mesobacillus subterraneus]MCM3686061.1 hypothetical protein [Mesobacillus subterraneus]